MFFDVVPNRNSRPTILIRQAYREGGKAKKRTLANITKLPPDAVEKIRKILRGAASALRGRIRNAENGIHASGFARGASNLKPSLDIPDRNCRTNGTLLLVVDVEGLPLGLAVHAASVQDRDGAPAVIVEVLEKAPHVKKIWGDGGYQGGKLASALKKLGIGTDLEIVKKPKDVNGFTVLQRRWVVERTFAWMSRCRRLAKDCERSLESSLAWAQLAACRFMMRRIARAATC